MNQRGLAESTQWAVLTPAFLALVLSLVQTGVWLHARTVAATAAAATADLRVHGLAQEGPARQAGQRIAVQGGLSDIEIGMAASGGVLAVTVAGRAPLFFDFGLGRVAQTAVLPLEQVTP